MRTEGGGVEIRRHRCWGRRPGLTVIVIRPTAAVADPFFFFFVINNPRRVGRNGTVIYDFGSSPYM